MFLAFQSLFPLLKHASLPEVLVQTASDSRLPGYIWLVQPAELLGLFQVQELLLCLGLCSQLGNKTQEWLVMQLVKCLVPKSDSWTLLCSSFAFALPSAHCEP